MVSGRLAPTPSGHLHLGNATAFAAAWLSARSQGGRVLLRIEDVDTTRARAEVEEEQRDDLRWLGLDWDEEVPRQSARDYAPWLDALDSYFCTCTRKDVQASGGVYPGTCRDAGHGLGKVRFRLPPGEVVFADAKWGAQRGTPEGDPVLRQADGVYAYNLAVVADDIADGVTEVVRGADLLELTPLQIRLWEGFGATPPRWVHAPLILGPDGRKLSKSHGSLHLGAMRDAGWTAAEVRRVVLAWLGMQGDALDPDGFDPARGPRGPIRIDSIGSPREGVSWVDEGGAR